MKLPLSWLKEYVEYNISTEEFIEKMMWRGFEVADVLDEMQGISGVYVGRIVELSKHPNADKLQVCSIDIGRDAPVQIVTGAQNVFEGALVPVALDGALLAGGLNIQPTFMRGVESEGMLCSGQELNITAADYPGADVDGILILDDKCKVGDSIQHAIDMDDIIFDIEVTPNRADCQSILGICREVAAALGQKFNEPVIRPVKGDGHAADYAKVEVFNSELCPRYAARVVTELNIAPSPAWMQKRLKAVGMRPINNIVDITNYVLAEYGHPMHAFDLSCVTDGHIVVRNAYENEIVTTLDSKQRRVTPDMLLIADPTKGVGVAGVMGGENSEITEKTQATIFESAVFKGSNIRATSRKLHHVTDAAARFIKGVEAVNAELAVNRAIELVDDLNAGKVIGDMIDVCSADLSQRKINVDCGHVNRILNTDISPKAMADMLATINIDASVEGDNMLLRIPHFRMDIERGIASDWDIAEEIGRIYGYYNIAPKLMHGNTFIGRVGDAFAFEDYAKDVMAGEGAYEIYNINFTGPARLDDLLLPQNSEKRQTVRLLNPFGEDQSLMRTTLYIGMLDTLARNCSRKTGHGRYFEVGNVHFDNNSDLPEERKLLGIAYMGENEDFYTLKGSVETLLQKLGILERASFRSGGGEYYHPGQRAEILVDGIIVGEMGTVHPKVQKAFDVTQSAYCAELSMKLLFDLRSGGHTYKAIPRYPKVLRDIAVVVNMDVTNAQLTEAIYSTQLPMLLEDVNLFDVYSGTGIVDGKKSMAYSFALRSDAGTLTDDEIQSAMSAIIKQLGVKHGAELRS